MPNFICHNSFVFLSFFACIIGLFLVVDIKKTQASDIEDEERMLLMMSFTYWLVYCVSFGIQKLALPEWDTLLLSLKLTNLFAYFLTFTCVLVLPLRLIAERQVQRR